MVLKDAFSALTSRVTDTDTRLNTAERRTSTLQDTGSTHNNQIANLQSTIENFPCHWDLESAQSPPFISVYAECTAE